MINAAFFDIDGVLTDGMVYVGSKGDEIKRISFKDIDAIFALKRAGVRIGFITGEDDNFSEYVKKRFSPDFFKSACKDKLSYFKEIENDGKVNRSATCFVGDSEKDIELLSYLDYSFVPYDVDDEIKIAAKYVTQAVRGNGVIKEVTKFIFARNKDL